MDALKSLKEDKIKDYPEAKIEDTDNGFIVEKDGKIIVKAIWLNKSVEQRKPYDIELYENETMDYIEVKATKTEEKDWFDLTKSQWIFMQETDDNFFIYRIYNAGSKETAKVVKICNPSKRWKEGSITAHPIRIQL